MEILTFGSRSTRDQYPRNSSVPFLKSPIRRIRLMQYQYGVKAQQCQTRSLFRRKERELLEELESAHLRIGDLDKFRTGITMFVGPTCVTYDSLVKTPSFPLDILKRFGNNQITMTLFAMDMRRSTLFPWRNKQVRLQPMTCWKNIFLGIFVWEISQKDYLFICEEVIALYRVLGQDEILITFFVHCERGDDRQQFLD